MGTFLDAQTSQNASFANSISIPVTTTPALFGSLGLNTAGATGPIRVEFSFTAAVSSLLTLLSPITIQIYRVSGGVSTLVYSASPTLAVAGLGAASTTVVSLNGADFNPPAPDNFLVYQAYISIPGGVTLAPTRVGPESFSAAAYSN